MISVISRSTRFFPSTSTRILARASSRHATLSLAANSFFGRDRNISELQCPSYRTSSRPRLISPCSLAALALRGFAEAPNKNDPSSPTKVPLRERILPKPLRENIYTVPNILTFSRLIAAPAVGYLIINDLPHYALGLFVYAGVTDLVDGWIARKYSLQTVVGSVVDPMADKALMTIATVCLAIQGALPLYLAVIILGRDLGLAISALYFRYISLPPPKTFARYWDFSLPSAEVHPTEISKYNTFFQIALIGATMTMPMIRGWGGLELEAALVSLQYFVAATTVWSGASYIFSKDAVKILSQGEAKQKELEQKGKETKS